MTALREEQTRNRCKQGLKQQQIKQWSNVIFWCSAKQATIIFKWLSGFWLAMVIICVERWSQIHGISWHLAMYIKRCVNKSKLLRYVRWIATATRENGFLGQHFTANKVRIFRNYQFFVYFPLPLVSVRTCLSLTVAHSKIYVLFLKLNSTTVVRYLHF